jgi:hypothetical protein
MKTKTIALPVATWEIISEAVSRYWDMGPSGEGWQSKELEAAESELRRQLESVGEDENACITKPETP